MAVNLTSTNFSYIENFQGTKTNMYTCAFPTQTGVTGGVSVPGTYGQGITLLNADISNTWQNDDSSVYYSLILTGFTGSSGATNNLGTFITIGGASGQAIERNVISVPQDCWLTLQQNTGSVITMTSPARVLVEYTNVVNN